MPEDLTSWPDALERVVARTSAFDRARVVSQTASTQDLADRLAGDAPGLVLVAGRQTQGRGRLGRAWADHPEHSLACSFVLDSRGAINLGELAVRVGLAACLACERSVSRKLGIRWPNDVVCPDSGKKLAGALVEARGELLIVGIGINVGHAPEDWPEELRDAAGSLRGLGSGLGRLDVLRILIVALDRVLEMSPDDVRSAWAARDVLVGTTRVFRHDGKRVEGMVRSIEPTGDIVVRSTMGDERLPAVTTSMVHEPR